MIHSLAVVDGLSWIPLCLGCDVWRTESVFYRRSLCFTLTQLVNTSAYCTSTSHTTLTRVVMNYTQKQTNLLSTTTEHKVRKNWCVRRHGTVASICPEYGEDWESVCVTEKYTSGPFVKSETISNVTGDR